MAQPIRFQELFQLTNLGVQPQAITFSNVTMESDKYICVRDEQNGQAQVVIVDMSNPQQPQRKPMAADSALMNPNAMIIAVKAAQSLQVFDLANKSKLGACNMPEPVVFWKWISATKLGLVSATSVYHWDIQVANSEPAKLFERHQSLATAQIINYTVDHTEKWTALVGVYPQDNRVVGAMQLYSVEKRVTQPLEAHAASFAKWNVGGTDISLLVFSTRTPTASKLHIIEVGGTPGPDGQPRFPKISVDVMYPPDAAADFPMAINVSAKYGVIFMLTKLGYAHLYEISTGQLIYMNRISAETVFVSTIHSASGGLLGINRKGQVLLLAIDDNNVVKYITNTLGNPDLGLKFAARNGLPGAEGVFGQQFELFFGQGNYKEAARVASEAPAGALRTPQTIQRFLQAPAQPGQPSPLLQYFGVLLEKGKLNKIESIELARLVIQQDRKQLLEKWIKEEKLEPVEELGDLLKPHDANLALAIYLRSASHQKAIQCFAETGAYDKIVLYAKKFNAKVDYTSILQNICRGNRQAALQFALSLAQNEGGTLIEYGSVVDIFMQFGMLQESTSFLLDALKNNNPSEGPLQTRLLEMNLMAAPQVADAILGGNMFTHYDRARIAALCEKAGLIQRALEHHTDPDSIKRCLAMTHLINPEFLLNYVGQMPPDLAASTLTEMLRVNIRGNLQVVVQIASKNAEHIGVERLIPVFTQFNSFEGLFFFLGAIVNTSQDPEVHFRYIEAAAKVGQVREVERIARESSVFDPKRVKDFLKAAKLPDQLPLIIVCDRFDMVDDLTQYLYTNNMTKYIEIYCQKINPLRTPVVVGALLDSDSGEDFIKQLVMSVRSLCPVEPLVVELEKRNRLKLLLPWLEARLAEGNNEPVTHNSLAKIYIDTNNNPEHFLNTNQFYDHKIVGAYCEKRDPHLAFLAYKNGRCDLELIDVTNRNALFKPQARYLVERQDPNLWAHVLDPENEFRRQIIDTVVQVALPECKNPDEVSTTVKAFMTADLPNELIELLEKIVLENSAFSDNRNLQNLLILTAIKADKARVMDYITRLDNYDALDIANISIGSGLYEEAFAIFQKSKQHLSAMTVLIENLHNIERAFEYAQRIDDPECWSALANAQLQENLVGEAIGAFMKANDCSMFREVIAAANREQKFEDLVKFLQMARKKVKDGFIETELVYAFAKVNNLSELEDFISGPNIAEIQGVGDRCFDEGLYQAAKILYNSISNYARLASALVHLGEFSNAVDAARKAGSTRTWKEVNKACVEAKEFKLAHTCGLHIIVHPDELDDLVLHYEERGYFDEVIALLEAGQSLDAAHAGIFTDLAILYTKHRQPKVFDLLKSSYAKLRVPKVSRACEAAHLWKELAYLYQHSEEYDSAALTMIEHSPEAWEHQTFKDIIAKVNNLDLFYRAVTFYINEQPTLLTDALKVMTPRIDHARVVQIVRRAQHLPLIKSYLANVQRENISAVNEALNELYTEEEDYNALRASIESFDKFDNILLAQKLESHELLEFRRIAATVYAKNKRWAQSVELSKRDKLYKDAIETAAESKDKNIAEDLARHFIEIGNAEAFSATLFGCYSLIGPDVALELAWRSKFMDLAMPYFVQLMKEYIGKVDTLVKEKEKEKAEKAAAEKRAQEETVIDSNPLALYVGPMTLDPAAAYAQQQGYGGGYGY
eukprot:TRINITY_DN293_c0_g1_i1.p1 TRINITY_DN293_c0_g1~~TRINITY_DN293_c0_g1_i1.p1  ORF type:complete len:1689 (+),score=479.53 TRINITY_DN293_c0_g1_i1:58-5067(+)